MSDQLCPGCPGDPNETCCKPELRVKVWMDKQKADMSDQKTEQKPEHEKRIREALLIAAVNCPHEITEDKVTFYFNVAKPGNNALDQLMTRLEDTAIRALLAELDAMRGALKFYADGNHFVRADADAWETVSGEPPNFWEDEANTATVEDGTVARAALKGATA